MKKKVIFLGLIVVLVIFLVIINSNQRYTYEWVKVEDSSIGQYFLYINDSHGKHVDGVARLVYINGKTKRVNVDKDGLLYVKNIVAEVRNPKKR